MSQQPLFEMPKKREPWKHGMHENSLASYDKIVDGLPAARRRVIRAIQAFGAGTCEQIASNMGVYPNTISGRFGELKQAGLIRVVGVGKSSSGNNADIWDVNKE